MRYSIHDKSNNAKKARILINALVDCAKAGISYAATAAMFVRKAEVDLPSPPEAVGQFNLTPAEVRVPTATRRQAHLVKLVASYSARP
jgi:hypothetical protein